MAKTTTAGRILINAALPKELQGEQELDKSKIQFLFQELAEKYPDQYIDTLQQLNDIARFAATEYGGSASVSLNDLKLPKPIVAYRQKLRDKVNNITQSPSLTPEQKNEQVVAILSQSREEIQKMVEKGGLDEDNAFALSIKKGFRGSPVQLTQLLFGDILMSDHKDRPLSTPGLHGYGEGVTPEEYWSSSYGSRKAFAGVQFSTAKSGFFGKMLAQIAQRLKVTGEDCNTNTGLLREGRDPDLVGSVLARDTGNLKAGTTIQKSHLPRLHGKMLVRSVATCQQPEGICQKCAGQREQGKFPSLGSYVGISAARIIAEPLTQKGLGSKHEGNVAGVSSRHLSGFEELNQFLQVPKTFIGGSILSPIDGKVTGIVKAPQGGHYLKINGEQAYSPPNRTVTVQVGENVEAGDLLTDGTPNPAEIARYKGLGAGRDYFVNKFYDMLKDNGVPTHRRNVEVLARAFFDRVKITQPELLDYTIGDVVPYSSIQRNYTPREDSQIVVPARSVGQYLERPVLHFTIGTRITPKVAKFLAEEKVKNISVNKNPPGFEPEIIRLMDIPSSDPDWKTRLAGFGLKKSLLTAATKGAVSPRSSTSPIPSLMNPEDL